jgi:tripartite-type tricarboxylate transporter receptor subunit TctC
MFIMTIPMPPAPLLRKLTMPSRRHALLALTAATIAPALVRPAQAQDAAASYPSRPIRIVVGFAPGGATDLVARTIAQKLQDAWGQPVTIENKPGAGSNIGAETVMRAEPDGYTLLLGTIANATNMSLYRNLKYDILKDFAPISQLMAAPSVLVVSPTLQVDDLKGLIALARAKPGTLTYASSGAGGSPHLAGEMLEQRAGIQMVHVPYKGAAPALADVISGQVNLGFKTALSAIPSMQAGRLKPIAVAAARRLPQLPNVPTMAEAGLPDFEVSSWNGLLAPARTPPAIVAKLHRETVRILAQPDVRERFVSQAAEVVGSSPDEFRAYIRSEIERWGVVAKKANVVLE